MAPEERDASPTGSNSEGEVVLTCVHNANQKLRCLFFTVLNIGCIAAIVVYHPSQAQKRSTVELSNYAKEAPVDMPKEGTLSEEVADLYLGRSLLRDRDINENKWFPMIQAVLSDCDLPYQKLDPDSSGGFASCFQKMAKSTMEAFFQGKSVRLVGNMGGYTGNSYCKKVLGVQARTEGFSCFFKPPVRCQGHNSTGLGSDASREAREYFRKMPEAAKPVEIGELFEAIEYWFFQPNQLTKKQLLKRQHEVGLSPLPLVAMHIRRGDKDADKYNRYHLTKEYVQAVYAYASQAPWCTDGNRTPVIQVYVASDSENALAEVKTYLQNVRAGNCSFRVIGATNTLSSSMSTKWVTTGTKSAMAGVVSRLPGDKAQQAMYEILFDIYMLSRATFLVGTYMSQIARLARGLHIMANYNHGVDVEPKPVALDWTALGMYSMERRSPFRIAEGWVPLAREDYTYDYAPGAVVSKPDLAPRFQQVYEAILAVQSHCSLPQAKLRLQRGRAWNLKTGKFDPSPAAAAAAAAAPPPPPPAPAPAVAAVAAVVQPQLEPQPAIHEDSVTKALRAAAWACVQRFRQGHRVKFAFGSEIEGLCSEVADRTTLAPGKNHASCALHPESLCKERTKEFEGAKQPKMPIDIALEVIRNQSDLDLLAVTATWMLRPNEVVEASLLGAAWWVRHQSHVPMVGLHCDATAPSRSSKYLEAISQWVDTKDVSSASYPKSERPEQPKQSKLELLRARLRKDSSRETQGHSGSNDCLVYIANREHQQACANIAGSLTSKPVGPCAFQIQSEVRLGPDQRPTETRRNAHEAIVSLHALAHANYFLGSWDSSLDTLVSELRWARFGEANSTYLVAGGTQPPVFSEDQPSSFETAWSRVPLS